MWRASGGDTSLEAGGLSIRDQFLGPSLVRALADCASCRHTRGDFAAARIGVGRSLRRREDIRGDSTCWIAPPLFPAERELLDDLERLRRELNRDTLLGLFELELHYAWYPPGTGYVRHVDQPRGSERRKVSLVLYLNEGWEPDAGGALRIYDAAASVRDIEPIAGRLVCFLTAEREHEVLPATRERWSISGWFSTRA
ncbi:MAG TPA: 2OG-Fe(II) oxygenase [Steroidobacteraceae bacterium]